MKHNTPRSSWAVLPATLAALSLAVLLQGCGGETQPRKPVVRPVKTMVVGDAGATITRSFPGRVEASKKVEMAFKVKGPLIELPATEGQPVKKNDLLAKIDPRDFQTALKDAQAKLEESQAQLAAMKIGARPEDLKTLEAQRDSAKATLDKTIADLKRMRTLLDSRTISREEYDAAVADYELAKAKHKEAEQELEKGRVGARKEDIQAKEAEIKRLEAGVEEAQNALDDTELRAPYDGVVAKRFVENRQNVLAEQPIVQFQDIEEIEIVVDVPESDTQVNKENVERVTAEFAVLPGQTFKAQTKEFSTMADPDTQTFQVRLAVQLPDEQSVRVFSGSSATVFVRLKPPAGSASDGFLVPISAVADSGEGPFVWVIDSDGKVHRRKVTVGTPAGASIPVTGGLKSGETIATAGVHELREDMKVKSMED